MPRFRRRPRPFWVEPLRKAALAGGLAFVAVFLARTWDGADTGSTIVRAIIAAVVIFAIGFVLWSLLARFLPPGGGPRR